MFSSRSQKKTRKGIDSHLVFFSKENLFFTLISILMLLGMLCIWILFIIVIYRDDIRDCRC